MPGRKNKHGFTIVELLAVIGAIAILLGVLLVGLQSASRMSQNVRSMSRLKQIHVAWTTYANAYEDRLLPGYLDEEVQDLWRVRYRGADGERLQNSDCTTYPLRLLPYLDFSLDPMYGYSSRLQVLENNFANAESADHQAVLSELADTPAFGYNAYYVGGWWEARSRPDIDANYAHLIFGDTAAEIGNPPNTRTIKGRLVATTMNKIPDPSSLMAFCSAVFRDPGAYVRDDDGNPSGAAWVTAPRLCTEQIWRSYLGDGRIGIDGGAVFNPMRLAGEGLEVLVPEAVPFRRNGLTVPLINCDGSTQQGTIEDLLKMNRWTPAAMESGRNSTSFQHDCDVPGTDP
ncbi:MAG: prepilin-type N-terminal cleavage/methylation domain-containing protein [Phycisphaerales bacterium]|nr:prepilin-type N-terminal cleavage/methylation domain-containing protein [Phycisphaerales bacterium]